MDVVEETREILRSTLRALCDFPDESSVESQSMVDGSVAFLIRVKQPDVGKVIGSKGRMAISLRTLVSSIGASRGRRLHVIINDGTT